MRIGEFIRLENRIEVSRCVGVRVAHQGRQDAHIATALQVFMGKGVAKGVWVYPSGHSGFFLEPVQHTVDAAGSEGGEGSGVDEHPAMRAGDRPGLSDCGTRYDKGC